MWPAGADLPRQSKPNDPGPHAETAKNGLRAGSRRLLRLHSSREPTGHRRPGQKLRCARHRSGGAHAVGALATVPGKAAHAERAVWGHLEVACPAPGCRSV
jgi:hypothetical protein